MMFGEWNEHKKFIPTPTRHDGYDDHTGNFFFIVSSYIDSKLIILLWRLILCRFLQFNYVKLSSFRWLIKKLKLIIFSSNMDSSSIQTDPMRPQSVHNHFDAFQVSFHLHKTRFNLFGTDVGVQIPRKSTKVGTFGFNFYWMKTSYKLWLVKWFHSCGKTETKTKKETRRYNF